MLEKQLVLEETAPGGRPAGHGYVGPATDAWARMLMGMLCSG